MIDMQEHRRIPREYSGLELYYLPGLRAYLKIGDLAKNSNLTRERDALEWLAGKLYVPKLLDFEIADGREFILISEIPGKPYADLPPDASVEWLAHVAVEIRTIHELPVAECPLDERLAVKLAKAEQNIAGGFVDESGFDSEDLGKSGPNVLAELLSSLPGDEDLVFTHGDLCLPNIIVSGGAMSGFIDFDRAGVADRYQDIALFLRSFRYNTGFDGSDIFCRAYGLGALDRDKLDFYRKLDELF